jgi:hypothetical protein
MNARPDFDDAPAAPAIGKQAWTTPGMRSLPAKEAENNTNFGPEILVLHS